MLLLLWVDMTAKETRSHDETKNPRNHNEGTVKPQYSQKPRNQTLENEFVDSMLLQQFGI